MKKLILYFVIANLAFVLSDLKADFNEKLQLLISQPPPSWMLEQINKDLENYKDKGITQESIERTMRAIGNEYCVRYKINDQQLSYIANEEGTFFKDRRNQILRAFEKLVAAVPLPNVEVIINPLDTGYYSLDKTLAPTLVFSKNKEIDNQILIPDLDAFNNYAGIGNQIEVASEQYHWGNKINKAFWRGATTGGDFNTEEWFKLARAKLVLLSLRNSRYLNAKFSLFVQGAESNPGMLQQPRLRGKAVAQADSLKYKFLIDVDGNTCSWQRMYWILLSNSLLLKQVTNNIEWYYGILKPYEHYIPVKEDLSDLLEKIDWAKSNDINAQRIAENATELARKNLNEEMIYLYLYLVLVKYAELQAL